MAIPPDIRSDAEAALTAFCEQHSSAAGADRQRYTYALEPSSAVLIEQRPSFLKPEEWTSKPIAKFRYSEARNVWSLYWVDANERWHRVSNVKTEKSIQKLLEVVLADPLGVFWS